MWFITRLILTNSNWKPPWNSIEIKKYIFLVMKTGFPCLLSVLFYTGLQWRYVKMSKLDLCVFLAVWSNFIVTSHLTRDVILRFNVGLVQTLSLYWATAVYANILPLIFFFFTVFLFPIYSVLIGKWKTALSCSVVWWGEQQYQLFWPQA